MTTAQQVETKLSFTAPVDALLEAASKVMSVVPPKHQRPILTNVRLGVVDGVLEMSGSDGVSGIYYAIPAANVTSEGVGLLNGVMFLDYLKEFRGRDVTIAFNPRGGCRFKADGGEFKILGDDPRDYPHLVRFDHHPGITVPGVDLVDMVKKTAFAVDENEARLATNGVLFEHKGGRFRLVATDRMRMSINQRDVQAGQNDFSATVPATFLKSLLKVVSKDVATGQTTIGLDSDRIFFRLGTATIYGLVLEGKFPPYEEALRIVLSQHIDCSVSELLATIRRACLVDKSLCAFNFTNGELRLKSTGASVGTGKAEMPILYTGPDVRVGLNPVFIREGLEVMTAKRCRFSFQGPRNAGVVKELITDENGVEAVSDRYLYAVLPIVLPAESADDV